MGHHCLPRPWVLPAFRSEGYHIVSIGYRMLPHATFADAVSDLQSALAWLRSNLPSAISSLSPQSSVDIDAYITAGDSAGGILSVLMPFVLSPPPRAVFEAYAITDLWEYHPPKPAFFPLSGLFSEGEIREALQERDKGMAMTGNCYNVELPPPYGRVSPETLEKAIGRRVGEEEQRRMAIRNDMSNYCLKHKLTLPLLFRHTSLDNPILASGSPSEIAAADAQYRAEVEKLSPLHLLRKQNHYPPTVIWHGTTDGGVPHSTHALPFLKKLDARGVDSLALYAVGASHVFDAFIVEPSDRGWTDFVAPTMDFLQRHVPSYDPDFDGPIEKERAKL